MKNILITLAFLLVAFATPAQIALDPVLVQKAEASIAKGVEFLLAKQMANGAWISHPAVTGLCVVAIHEAKSGSPEAVRTGVEAGLNYILMAVQPDGSIWSKEAHEYPNYTTSISLLALARVNRPRDAEAITNARRFLQGAQFNDPNSIDYGGIGYSKTGHADLTNLSFAVEALAQTDYLDREPYNNDPAAAKRTQELWSKVQTFIANCQNLPESNKQGWVSRRADDYGGFVYRPTESKAGSIPDESGTETLVSSGSVTYSGLMSMIHAKMDRNDLRVRGAMDYIAKHYTVKENPGMGQQGRFFYLNVMTKAFAAYGEETIVDAAGAKHRWREEVLTELCALQKPEGFWVNENGRFMESVPELMTAHCVNAIRIAMAGKK